DAATQVATHDGAAPAARLTPWRYEERAAPPPQRGGRAPAERSGRSAKASAERSGRSTKASAEHSGRSAKASAERSGRSAKASAERSGRSAKASAERRIWIDRALASIGIVVGILLTRVPSLIEGQS